MGFLYPIDLTCKSPDCRSVGDPPRAAWDPSPRVGEPPGRGPRGLLRKFAKGARRLAIRGFRVADEGREGRCRRAGHGRIGDRSPTRVRARGVSGWEGTSAGMAQAQVSMGWRGVRIYDAPTAGKGREGRIQCFRFASGFGADPSLLRRNLLKKLARPRGVEPLTPRSIVCRPGE
jgi:hypothetical protein